MLFQYYAHREKMALIGREDELEQINRNALRMAREVADETGTLMAGNISNTNIFVETVPNYRERVWQMFKVSKKKLLLMIYPIVHIISC